MNFIIPNMLPAAPEIFLLVMVCIVLIADLFITDERRFITYALTQATLLGCAVITAVTADMGVAYTFGGMFVDDPMADGLKLMTYIAVSVALVYSRDYITLRGLYRGEFFALVLFSLLGMMVMISANHFLTLYLGLELLALCLYALVALQRDSAQATEAAMKYFILGALASGLLLYGMSMVYGVTGTLDVAQVARAIQDGAAVQSAVLVGSSASRTLLVFGLVFIVAGLAFKLGAAPFHMWIPDVYQGAPTAITLLIGSAPEFATFAFFMRLLVSGLQGLVVDWQGMLVVLAVTSMAIGNITAIAQTNLKRMLAYSTISHMGFLLMGILAGTLNGYGSAMFYMAVYVLMSLGSFGMILLLSRAGFEAENLDDFKGLNKRSPWYAFLMLLLMFSMAGIPPTIGFFAKLAVFQAALEMGYTWLVVVAVLFSLIGAFYYLRIVKLMYFDAPLDSTPLTPQVDMRVLLGANGLAMLALGILPNALLTLCINAIRASLG